jgi:thiosulfate dehydrogenase [quinone] large subunit
MKRTLEVSSIYYWFVADKRAAWLWLIVRVWLGWQWVQAGWEKFNDPAWIGSSIGTAINGFGQGALAKTAGAHPDVQWWYAIFIQHTIIAHPVIWSYAITFGEMAVGLGLILGCLTGTAAFFGVLMNFDFMLAGSVSINPVWALLGILIILARRVAGYWGADRYVLPLLAQIFRSHLREG